MPPATKFLPDNYVPAGSVTLNSKRDLNAMLLWSVLLLLLSGWGAVVVLNSVSTTINSFSFTFSAASWTNILLTLGGILMVTAVMVVIHEGLHGLVFWWITHEMPKFAFKGFYASASAPGWYIGKLPYLIAALLPLFAITSFGLLIIPLFTPAIQFLLALPGGFQCEWLRRGRGRCYPPDQITRRNPGNGSRRPGAFFHSAGMIANQVHIARVGLS